MTPNANRFSRILFIGNSYTTRNQLPRLLVDLAATAEQPKHVEVATIFAGGASLRRHWNAGMAQKSLAASTWDYVVLQEQSTLPVKNAQRYHENVRLFAAEIASHGAKIALYLTWSRQQAPQTQDQITRAVEDIAAEVGALVVPVGPAWHATMRQDAGLMLYEDDGSHPTAAGSYLAACVFLVRLFDQPPFGWSVSDRLRIDRAVAAKLQQVAWTFRART
jgi:lysophospholipase L1-like esterase